MFHHKLRLSLATLILACAAARSSHPQATSVRATPPSPDELVGMLAAAGARAKPETTSSPAFHLHASFHTFDVAGKPDGDGTVEAFWDGASRSRHTITYRGASQTIITNHGTYTSPDAYPSSLGERTIVRALFSPVPQISASKDRHPEQKAITLAGLPATCVVFPYQPVPHKDGGSGHDLGSALGPEIYCLAGGTTLRLVQFATYLTVAYNKLERWGSQILPHQLTLNQGKLPRATMEVDTLVAWTPDDATFSAPAGASLRPEMIQAECGVVAGSIVSKTVPVYPQFAKERHIAGSVLMAAIISQEGTVRDLEVISSPDASLSASAMEAVKQWRYKPYLLNGLPTEVDTSITVNYSFGTGPPMMIGNGLGR